MTQRNAIRVSFAIVLAVGSVQHAQAQEKSNDASRITLEEIIVTAQKRAESLQDVPIAITVTTQEQIQRDQIYSLSDLQRTTPALEINQTFGGETGGGRIRGIGTNVFNQTAEGSVAIVVDGVPSGNVPNPQIFDVAQIEVLRGPQGTLFGQTASAGVINMTTVAPDPSALAATFHADYSSNGDMGSRFGQQSIRGAVNAPMGENSALRVSAYGTRVEGVQHNVALNKDNETENYGARARYQWTPTDVLTINLIADYNDQAVDGADFFTYLTAPVATNPRTGLLANCGITPGFANQNYCSNRMADSHAKNYGYAALIDFETTGPTLTSISGYRRIDTASDYGEISRLIGDVPQIFFRNQLSSAHQFTQELRVSSPEDAAFDYVAGAYFSRYEYGNGVAGGSGGFNLVFPWPNTAPQCVFGGACSTVNGFTPSDVQNESIAGFADATFHVSEALRIFGGLRYTEQTIDATSGAKSDSLDESNVSGRLGAAYRLSPSTMFYASAARGYKGPVFFVSADPSVPSSSINAEIPTSYEIGAKWSLLDDRLAFDANVFYSDVEDYQAQVCTTSALGALQCRPTNVPKVESQGIELDVIGRPFDGLTLSAGLIYNSVEYPDGFLGSDGTNLGGEQLALAPKEKFVLSGEYSHALFGQVDGFIALDTVYRSELRLSDSANPLYTYPTSWQFGASLGLRGGEGQWTVSLFGRNLSDENIPLTVFGTNPSAGLWGWPIANQTLRQVGLTADFRF